MHKVDVKWEYNEHTRYMHLVYNRYTESHLHIDKSNLCLCLNNYTEDVF